MTISFYRNTSQRRWAHDTLPAEKGRRQHLLWVGPLFVLVQPGKPDESYEQQARRMREGWDW